MSRTRPRLRAAAAAALVAAALPLALSGAAAGSPRGVYADPAGVLSGNPVHGVSFQSTGLPPSTLIADLPRLKALGVNLVSIYITTYVDKVPRPTKVSRTAKTPTDQELQVVTDAIHNEGMAVEFMPVIWSPAKYVWRGTFDPEPANLIPFFNSYTRMVDHYADLADQLGVEIFSVGSELVRLQKHASLWRSLVDDVRTRYQGAVTYMSSKPVWSTMRWWGRLDLISISPYYSLTDVDDPSIRALVAAWKPAIATIKQLHDRWNKPVLFDEIGYASVLGTARDPALTHQHQDQNVAAQQPQARAYEALLRVVRGVDWIRGLVWFKWDPISETPALVDKSYSPRDKSAECVIAKYWAPAQDSLVTTVGQVQTACALARML
jgi:hypothetical protein